MAVDFEALGDLASYLETALRAAVRRVGVVRGELSLDVERDRIVDVIRFLREDTQCLFETLIDLAGVDYPERADRFDVVYHLLSMRMNQRIRVRVTTDEERAVPSLVGVFRGAGWYEREAFDLYGITFSDHPDLRRLLTDYGFEGYPMRKDFPLTGHSEVRYDELQKRVVYEPVTLTQEYRDFDFLSPWEGMTRVIPGDEKATQGKDDSHG